MPGPQEIAIILGAVFVAVALTMAVNWVKAKANGSKKDNS